MVNKKTILESEISLKPGFPWHCYDEIWISVTVLRKFIDGTNVNQQQTFYDTISMNN